MVELSDQKPEIVEYVLTKRPFRSLQDVEAITMTSAPGVTAKGNPRKAQVKKVGESVVNFAEQMWDGYNAVDELVGKCEGLGRPIRQAMKKWGFDIFGAAREGELAITNLDDIKSESNSARDSGIGTPRSAITIDDDDDGDIVRQQDRSKSKFLQKPAIMSDDVVLKDYQIVGLNWLNLLWEHEMSCILADDMGLGKTCQVIAFLSHLKELDMKDAEIQARQKKDEKVKNIVRSPHLIIVPGAVLENWMREFKKFSPELVVEPYYGGQKEREAHQDTILGMIGSIDVVVTTYDLAWKPMDNKFLRKLKPRVCIFDEGHYLKTPASKRYTGLMRIPADFRLLLTGTPLQNNLQELAAILAFIMPNLFQARNEELNFVFKHKAKTTDKEHSALLSQQRVARARSMMSPFILRRKKEQTLKNLPTKTNRVEYCEMLSTQKKIYDRLVAQQLQVLADREAGIENKNVNNPMMRLRQAAIHPFLFRELYDDDQLKLIHKTCMKGKWKHTSDPDIVMEELQNYSDYDFHDFISKHPRELGKFALKNEEWMNSGKVAKLSEILAEYKARGDRALIFSQFTKVMDILQLVLDTLNLGYMRIDGDTKIEDRQTMIDVWTDTKDIPVFLLSTKSGGTGINLTAANKIIIFDSSFNPQEDVQAENRAHRVGQTREVEVVRLVTKGTIEEQIHALGKSKLALDAMVNGESSNAKPADLEAKAMDTVAHMLLKELEKKDGGESAQVRDEEPTKEDEGVDIKDQFLDGLKKHGLDLSAA
jgi:SWI/SNF-related matrix-associated actin-dependent regulator 1 of chromatin subfamily A